MTTHTSDLAAVRALMLFSATTTLTLYWTVVCPTLYRHGARFPTGLLFHRWKRDLRLYRHLVSAKARPQSWYYVLLLLTWFTIGVAVIALVLALTQQFMTSHSAPPTSAW